MISIKILLFLVFSLCNCQAPDISESLHNITKKLNLEMPPKEKYEKLISNLGVENSRIVLKTYTYDEISKIHTEQKFPKDLIRFLDDIITFIDFNEPNHLVFDNFKDNKNYYMGICVAYNVKDSEKGKVKVACIDTEAFGVPHLPKDKYSFKKCSKFIFFKKCRRIFRDIIRGFNAAEVEIMHQALKAYASKEILKKVEELRNIRDNLRN